MWEEGKPFYAYHNSGQIDEFIKVDKCFLLCQEMQDVLDSLLQVIEAGRLKFIEEVVLRRSIYKSNFLLVLYGKPVGAVEYENKGLLEWADKVPLAGVVYMTKKPYKMRRTILCGNDYLEEKVGDKIFYIGPESFFQINVPLLNKVIYDLAGFLSLSGKEIIGDIYCGVGTYGIALSNKVKRVIGVEAQRENLFFLKNNIYDNDIGNYKVKKGKAESLIRKIVKEHLDIIILNPPRAGVVEYMCKEILYAQIPRIAYLSCNLSTLVRDLKSSLKLYKITNIKVYDYFPHTPHMEICTILEKR